MRLKTKLAAHQPNTFFNKKTLFCNSIRLSFRKAVGSALLRNTGDACSSTCQRSSTRLFLFCYTVAFLSTSRTGAGIRESDLYCGLARPSSKERPPPLLEATGEHKGADSTMRRTVLVLLALPALASAFLPGGVQPPALRNGPRSALSQRSSGLALARGAGRAATLQAAGLRMVKDSGNAVHYEPFLGLEERDACGVGFIANRGGERNHDIVSKVVTLSRA
jgi:hypothetical protein